MEISQNVSLKQEQKLSPQMLQSLALLPLPIAELKTYVEQEIEKNPALELPQDNFNSDFSELNYTDSEFNPNASEESDEHQEMLENTGISGESLSEHLLKQLGLSNTDDRTSAICQMLIGNLDSNGFFILSLDELFEKTDYGKKETDKALQLVQSFEPYGICCKDFRESLLIQAKCFGMHDSDLDIFSKIVYDHLENLKNGKFKETASALHISEEDLQTFFTILKSFTPYPGQIYSTENLAYTIPDFSIHQIGGELVLNINRADIPELKISEEFSSLSSNLKGPDAKETASYIKTSIRQAENLITQINMRFKTLTSAATALMNLQKDFFTDGPQYLKPLTLKDIASLINVHETTVSRLAQSKWVETDWGIFQMKYFFTRGIDSSDGQAISRTVVKDMISEILKQNPALSDQKISDLLAGKGIKCARRTVSKYRSELNIGSSFNRN